jgi:hypothetical protein
LNQSEAQLAFFLSNTVIQPLMDGFYLGLHTHVTLGVALIAHHPNRRFMDQVKIST